VREYQQPFPHARIDLVGQPARLDGRGSGEFTRCRYLIYRVVVADGSIVRHIPGLPNQVEGDFSFVHPLGNQRKCIPFGLGGAATQHQPFKAVMLACAVSSGLLQAVHPPTDLIHDLPVVHPF
jgi:hypothetical protein